MRSSTQQPAWTGWACASAALRLCQGQMQALETGNKFRGRDTPHTPGLWLRQIWFHVDLMAQTAILSPGLIDFLGMPWLNPHTTTRSWLVPTQIHVHHDCRPRCCAGSRSRRWCQEDV